MQINIYKKTQETSVEMNRFADGTIRLYNQNINILSMDKEVKARFDAISVAVGLLGEPQPETRFYTVGFCSIDNDNISVKHHIDILDGIRIIEVVSPAAFMWLKKWSEHQYNCLIIECEKDYTIKYPIRSYAIEHRYYSRFNVVQQFLNKKDTIQFLDNVLIKL